MRKHPDLSNYGNSVTSRFMVLLTPEYHKATLPELKEIALNILNDPETSVSIHKKRSYEMEIHKQKSVSQFQFYITNLTMKGCNLSLNT
jgi:hypothetical protein